MVVLELANIPAGWVTVSQPFLGRALCVAALDKKIDCIGGMDDGESMSGDVDVFDTSTGEWSAAPDIPRARMKGFGSGNRPQTAKAMR